MKKSDLDKLEKLPVNKTPAGSNNSTTRALFYQRKLYDISYSTNQPGISGESKAEYKINYSNDEPDRPAENMYIFNFRDSDVNYGRLDRESDEINLIENNLKQLPVEEETLFALKFVVDAFSEFKYDIETKYTSQEFKSEFYKELKPKAAWINPLLAHHKQMEMLYVKFNKYLQVSHKNKKIIDFKDYLQNFLHFVDSVTPMIAINRTTFIINRDATPLYSGLVVELENKPVDSDNYKYKNFISSYDYAIFRQTAIKYGFRVDQHVPWRLIFDVDSIEAQKYINFYGISTQQVYNSVYVKTRDYDIEVLKRYILGFYNSYVSQNPELSRANIEYVDSQLKTSIQLLQRQSESLDNINIVYNDFFWIKLYCFIKLREYNVNIEQSTYLSFIKRMYDDYQLGGLQQVFNELKKISRDNSSPKKNRSYFFTF